jgi:hypothetical protein
MTDKKDKTEFEKFSDATKLLMSVPKKEIDRRHEEWAKEKEKRRKTKKTLRASRDSGDHDS